MYCILGTKVHRTPGDRWMVHGPTDYIPRTEVGNITQRSGNNLIEIIIITYQ